MAFASDDNVLRSSCLRGNDLRRFFVKSSAFVGFHGDFLIKFALLPVFVASFCHFSFLLTFLFVEAREKQTNVN